MKILKIIIVLLIACFSFAQEITLTVEEIQTRRANMEANAKALVEHIANDSVDLERVRGIILFLNALEREAIEKAKASKEVED